MAQPNARPSQGQPQPRTGSPVSLTVPAVQDFLEQYAEFIKALAPKYFSAERVINLAVNAFMKVPKLLQCTQASIMNSVCTAVQLGLEPNTALGHGWLIPYKDVCQFQPGYRGLIHLALQSPRVHAVGAQVVYPADEFSLSYGTEGKLFHRPNISAPPDEENFIGAYTLVKYTNGCDPSYLFMSRWQIEKTRNKSSKSWQDPDSPWQSWPEEMRKKTVTKRLLKMEELGHALGTAVGADDQHEAGRAQDAILPKQLATPENLDALDPTVDRQADTRRREGQAGSSAPPPKTEQPKPETKSAPGGTEPPRQETAAGVTVDSFDADDLRTLTQWLQKAKVALNRAQLTAWLQRQPSPAAALKAAENLAFEAGQQRGNGGNGGVRQGSLGGIDEGGV